MQLSLLDGVALAVFVATWSSYAHLLEASRFGRRSLNAQMDRYRRQWLETVTLTRENRVIDTTVMASLQNGAAFFSSSAALAIGGSLALLQAGPDLQMLFAHLPLVPPMTPDAWQFKVVGLALIFGLVFVKTTWAYRLFNFSAILLAATPMPQRGEPGEAQEVARAAATMMIAASRQFTAGQRAFIYALAWLGWFLGPVPLILSTLGLTGVMLWRQYGSSAARAMQALNPRRGR